LSEFVDNLIVLGVLLFIFILIWKKVTNQTLPEMVAEIREAFSAAVPENE